MHSVGCLGSSASYRLFSVGCIFMELSTTGRPCLVGCGESFWPKVHNRSNFDQCYRALYSVAEVTEAKRMKFPFGSRNGCQWAKQCSLLPTCCTRWNPPVLENRFDASGYRVHHYPTAKRPYGPDYRAYAKLKEGKKLIDPQSNEEELRQIGIKYFCFNDLNR